MWLNIDSAKCLFSLAFSKLFSNRMFLLLLLLLLVECLIHNSCKWFGAADFNWHVLSNKQSSLHAWLAWNVNRFGDNQFQESNCELVGWAPEWIPRTTRNKWKKTERRCRNRIKGRPLFFFGFLWFICYFVEISWNHWMCKRLTCERVSERECKCLLFVWRAKKRSIFILAEKSPDILHVCRCSAGKHTMQTQTDFALDDEVKKCTCEFHVRGHVLFMQNVHKWIIH